MAIVQNILNNLRTDLLTITTGNGYANTISKAFKDLRFVGDLKDSDFLACYIGADKEIVTIMGDKIKKCELSIFGLVYYNIATDTLNAGTLESKAESLREDLYILNETWATAIQSLDADNKKAVESIEIISITPYINTGFPDKGELEFELKIIYYRS